MSIATVNNIDRRIKVLVKHFTKSDVKNFAKEIGVSEFTIYSIIKKKSAKPNYIILAKIVLRYPEVNAHWLLTGHGKPFNTQQNQIEI